jgi:hypothetical protein
MASFFDPPLPPPHPSSDDLPGSEWTAEDLAVVEATERHAEEAAKEEKRQRDFERSLAGPSVGKAGTCDMLGCADVYSEAKTAGRKADGQHHLPAQVRRR